MGTYQILIETYWNVNDRELQIIAESISILIETYWNVNSDSFTDAKTLTQY